METKYFILNQYRIDKDETWEKFSDRFVEYGEIPMKTLHKVCTGKSNPNERTAAKLDRFIRDHRAELDKLMAEEPEFSAASVQAGGRSLTVVHGHMPAGAVISSVQQR